MILKKLLIFPFIFMVFMLTSCTNSNKKADNNMAIWLKNADLNTAQTPEELYEKALKEDTLIVYSNSTRMMDVKKSFEQQYPGLTVYVQDIRGLDLIENLKNNFETQTYNCDVAFCSNKDGLLYEELVPNGILHKYVPYDISDKIKPENNQELLMLVGEVQQIFYNDKIYNSPPINNWWELTDEKLKGKVVMANPIKSISTMGLLSMIIKNDKLMEDAYYDYYGKKLNLLDEENAGQAFIRKLVENDVILVNSADEIVDLIGTPNQISPTIGIMISSKIRMKDIGYNIKPIFDIEPFCGTYSPSSIMIAGGSKNINCAKLFIRWILGEKDGQGEGYKPYLQKGVWSVRKDVKSQEKVNLEDIQLLELDPKYMYENKDDIYNFWLSLVENK